jgi:hypothetical protein
MAHFSVIYLTIWFYLFTYLFFRRIVGYDDWSQIVIHVALDNAVIEEEIRK